MKSTLFTLIVFIGCPHLIAQYGQDYFWVTGFDTNAADGIITPSQNFGDNCDAWKMKEHLMSMGSNNASLCDAEGHLLLYFNGCMLANGQHTLVENGDSINSGSFQDVFWGDCQKFGYPGQQDVMILPNLHNEGSYYVFHKLIDYTPGEEDNIVLSYTYVEGMFTKDDIGLVTEKNVRYYEGNDPMRSYFSAIIDDDHAGYWILQPVVEDSVFLTFYVGDGTIDYFGEQPTYQYFDRFRSSSGGTAKFSPDGTKYALYNYIDQLHMYDFDRSTGMLSNHNKVQVFPDSTIDHCRMVIR